MRLTLHTLLCCCCVFITVVPLVIGATGEIDFNLKKRFTVWLQGHLKRDPGSSAIPSKERPTDVPVGREEESGPTVLPPLRSWFYSRLKRSAKSSGCALVTCVYQDLIHLLLQVRNSQIQATAPADKIGARGYGRRRRSLLVVSQIAAEIERQRQKSEACRRLGRHTSKCPME